MDSRADSETENTGWSQKTDEELILMCDVDREAFGELARRYQPMAFRAAFSVLRSEPDASDQVQSALCKALQHIGSFRRQARFSTWLIRIVVNECLMQLRRNRRADVLSLDDRSKSGVAVEVRDGARSAEADVAENFLAHLINREVRHIPPLLRNVLVLRDVQEKPMPEVARRLGISVTAAKSRLSRAREELRKRMTPHVTSPGPRPPLETKARDRD
jgi:RNA polymerase sigma-70 factor, ECF subfamily